MIITGFIYKLEHKASTLKISRGRRRGREKFNKSYRSTKTAKPHLAAFILSKKQESEQVQDYWALY